MGRMLSLVLSSAVLATVSSSAFAAGIGDYALTRTFTLPSAVGVSNPTVLFDNLADGRLLAVNETQVLAETAVGSGTFTSLGTIPNFAPTFGPSFLTVSPDGTRAAVGSNGGGAITVFNTAAPATATNYTIGDTDAAWIDNNRLAVSNFNGVQVLTLSTAAVKTVVGNVGGATGGVAFDAAGNLYTGNGYDLAVGGSETGTIKRFDKTAWEIAAAGGTALDFEAGTNTVADLLSASSLGFDASGNLFVGGGDFYGTSGDYGYAALVAAGSTGVTPASSADVLRKFASPADTITAAQPPIWAFNEVTGELYLRYFQNGGVGVYSVPEPTAMCGLMLAGLAALRGRRRAVTGVALAAASTASMSEAQAYTYDPNDFATEVVSSTGLAGTTLYNDPSAVLGRPALRFNNGTAASPDYHRVKPIEGTFNTGPGGEKLITTLNANQSITVRMGRPITNDPSHPFGIDFNVFGNAFFTPVGADGFINDSSNLNTIGLGNLFAENVRVSVSPDNVNWYTYAGVTADGYFPTTGYLWNRTNAVWSELEADPTTPVDPSILANLSGKSAADLLDLYNGAAGGAGFDLAASGFASVQYVRFDGVTGFAGGEIDAVAAVPEPAMLGGLALAGFVLLRRRQA